MICMLDNNNGKKYRSITCGSVCNMWWWPINRDIGTRERCRDFFQLFFYDFRNRVLWKKKKYLLGPFCRSAALCSQYTYRHKINACIHRATAVIVRICTLLFNYKRYCGKNTSARYILCDSNKIYDSAAKRYIFTCTWTKYFTSNT